MVPDQINKLIKDADFPESLKLKENSEKSNDSKRNISFIFNCKEGFEFTLIATQHDQNPYVIDDFAFDSHKTIFNEWYDSVKTYLKTTHKESSDNALATNLLDLANNDIEKRFPNLASLVNEKTTLYAIVSEISDFKEFDQKITFKVTLENITDNTVRIKGVLAQLHYTQDLGTEFTPSQFKKSLALDDDGIIPTVQNLNKFINVNDIYN